MVVSLVFLSAIAQAPSVCDIYGAAGTPCVAAHSMTRALYADYSGNLYEVQRSSDNTRLSIGVKVRYI